MRVRVATLNVWGLPQPLAKHVGARIRAIGERLPDLALDVVAFQEVWTPKARRRLVRAGRGCGMNYSWYNDTPWSGGGLLVISRLPIEAVRFNRFALRGLPQRVKHGDFYGGKGFAKIRLTTDVGPVAFIDTHLHAHYAEEAYVAHRTGQVVELAMNALQTIEPIVAVGDFNFRENHDEYEVLTGLTGFRDVAAELEHREPTALRNNAYRRESSKPDRRIDYVFTRDGNELAVHPRSVQRVLDENFAIEGEPASYSDHTGLVAELEIASAVPTRLHVPQQPAIDLASRLLSEGRALAERRQADGRALAGILGCGILATSGIRRLPPVSRRRLLRNILQGTALVALTPGLGASLLSEVFVPQEIQAFDRLAERLAQVGRGSEIARLDR